jgi:DNA polymerase III delta subunit
MAAENALAFLRALAQSRPVPPFVLIAGPQAFLREYAIDSLRRRLARENFKYRAFQVGAGDGFGAVVSELEGADMFAPNRLIACRVMRSYRERGGGDADEGEPRGGRSDGGEAALLAATERIAPAVRFALLYEKDNAPAKMRRAAEKSGAMVNCMRPFDNQIGQYVELFARNLGLKLPPAAADLLIGRHGGDLAAIANSLAKAAIVCGDGGRVEAADLGEAGATHIPELFELAESIARGDTGETLALFDRAVQTGRDPIELLAVEIIPLVRRMLAAASVMERRKGAGDVASALGLPPSSNLLARAVDGARKFGQARLLRAHRRACELDANFKLGLLKEREQAIAAMLIELMAGG